MKKKINFTQRREVNKKSSNRKNRKNYLFFSFIKMNSKNLVFKDYTINLINLPMKAKRSSIIPFFVKNNTKYYFMAIGRDYGSIIDMGGKIDPGESFITSSIRELNEESIGVFDYRQYEDQIINDSITIYDDDNIVTFIEIDVSVNSPNDLIKEFKENYQEKITDKNTQSIYLENIYMIYISEDDLRILCKSTDDNVKIPYKLSKVLKPYNNIQEEFKYPSDVNFITKKTFLKGLTYYPAIYPKLKKTLIGGFKGFLELSSLY